MQFYRCIGMSRNDFRFEISWKITVEKSVIIEVWLGKNITLEYHSDEELSVSDASTKSKNKEEDN